jgi:hypothetical protein
MPLPQGYRAVYIGRSDELEPSIKPTLINGIDAILKVAEDRRTKAADKWAQGWLAGHALCQVAPLWWVAFSCLLESS